MTDGSNIDIKESDNAFKGSDDTIIDCDVDINDLDKLKTEVMALKMFITDQLHLLKQMVGNPKTPECKCNSKSDRYIKPLIEQIHSLKEENKMKNSFIKSLLFQNSSTTITNDLFCNNDKADEIPPASNDGHIFDDTEGTKDEDINDENKNLEKNRKNSNIKKKRNTQNAKDQNKEININTKHNDNKNIISNSIHQNSTAPPPK